MAIDTPHITLTAEQSRTILSTKHPVQVRDLQGKVVGFLQPIGFTEEEIEEAVRRSEDHEGELTTRELLDRLENARRP